MSQARPMLWVEAGISDRARTQRRAWLPRPLADADPELGPAVATLAKLAGTNRFPLEAQALLAAYALVERLRAAQDGEVLGVDLWPPAVLEALGVERHACAELFALAPDCDVVLGPAETDDVDRAGAALLGCSALEPDRYRAALERSATAQDWVPARTPDAKEALPERATAAALLVREGKVLLERRPADAPVTPGVWDSPGGHVEEGETPLVCLAREMQEELGLALGHARLVDVVTLDESPPRARYRHMNFRVDSWFGDPVALEGAEISWHPLAEALRLPDLNPALVPALARLVEPSSGPARLG